MVTDLEYIEKMFKEHQERNDAQFASLEKYLTLKIESDKCDTCSISPRIKKEKKRIDILMNWRIYLLALGSIIAIFLPTIIDKILIKLF